MIEYVVAGICRGGVDTSARQVSQDLSYSDKGSVASGVVSAAVFYFCCVSSMAKALDCRSRRCRHV